MNNREKYRRTFSTVHTSRDYLTEVRQMKKSRKQYVSKSMAACAAIVLAIGISTAGYAANIGGIQRTIQLWIHGDQTSAVLDINDDGPYTSYNLSYQDENGNTVEQSGGGIAIEENGVERPLTKDELLEDLLGDLNSPEVSYEEDGTVWVYYYNRKINITDKFDENGICYVQLSGGDHTLYLTIKYQGGYSYSENRYPSPEGFD